MSYEHLPLEFLNKEVVALGNWWQCSTNGFIGDIRWNKETARGFCQVKPEPGSKLRAKCMMRNQDRFLTEPVKEKTGIDLIFDNRDAILEEKARNDAQDDRLQALEHNVEVLMNHLPGYRPDSTDFA